VLSARADFLHPGNASLRRNDIACTQSAAP
jgi:hypothetical protein